MMTYSQDVVWFSVLYTPKQQAPHLTDTFAQSGAVCQDIMIGTASRSKISPTHKEKCHPLHPCIFETSLFSTF